MSSSSERTGAGGGGGGARMAVVTDQHIAEALNALLREQNPNNPAISTLNGIVQHLEAKLGLNLSHKIDFLRSQIQLFFQPPPAPPQLQQQQQQQLHHKEHFTLQHHNPNFSHHQVQHHPHYLPPNYVVTHHPQEYAFRPQQYHQQPHFAPPHIQAPPQPQPPRSVVTTVAAPPPTPAIAAAAEPPKESAPTKKRRGGPGGLNKLCGVSPELQVVVGQPTMPRTEIVRQLWQYIRKHNLQDPNNKRKIICNDELRVVFETDSTDMFKMNKLLAKHIIALEPTKQPNSKKVKVEVESGSEPIVPNASTAQNKIVVVSEALANLFGSSEREMTQEEVTRQMWEYIKVNQLEDPLNKMAIQCDAKLQELFGCPSISAVGIQEMLARHHLFQKS